MMPGNSTGSSVGGGAAGIFLRCFLRALSGFLAQVNFRQV